VDKVIGTKRLFIVDDFYSDPDKIREYALGVEFESDLRYYKGNRSKTSHILQGTKEAFESIMGERITRFYEHGMNGRFQICTAEDPVVYHSDGQKWAAMVYLSPNAPFEAGTRLMAHRETKARHPDHNGYDRAFAGGFLDGTKFEMVDFVGNVYNRLMIFNSRCIHAAAQYFGTDNKTGRLTHLFFFD